MGKNLCRLAADLMWVLSGRAGEVNLPAGTAFNRAPRDAIWSVSEYSPAIEPVEGDVADGLNWLTRRPQPLRRRVISPVGKAGGSAFGLRVGVKNGRWGEPTPMKPPIRQTDPSGMSAAAASADNAVFMLATPVLRRAGPRAPRSLDQFRRKRNADEPQPIVAVDLFAPSNLAARPDRCVTNG